MTGTEHLLSEESPFHFRVAVSRGAACLRAAPRVHRQVPALCKRSGEYFMSPPSKPRHLHMHARTAGQARPDAERRVNGRAGLRRCNNLGKKIKSNVRKESAPVLAGCCCLGFGSCCVKIRGLVLGRLVERLCEPRWCVQIPSHFLPEEYLCLLEAAHH